MARSVLIVDDERSIVEVLAELLEGEGYAVRRAYDGEPALHQVEEVPPDLVLCDVEMPGLDGVELARRLTARGIPVVLMSAAVADPGFPGVAFIPKLFDLDRILSVAGNLLAHPPAEAGVATVPANPATGARPS